MEAKADEKPQVSIKPTKKTKKNDVEDDDSTRFGGEPVPFLQLFRFSTGHDRLMLTLGLLAALISSTCFPILNILFGEMSEIMVNMKRVVPGCNGSMDATTMASMTTEEAGHSGEDQLLDKMSIFAIYMTATGTVELICGYLFISIFRRTAEKMTYRLRVDYLRTLLRQDIAWFDTVQDKNFVSKISEDLSKVQDAIGEKVGFCAYYLCCSVVCLVSAFWYGWLLSLVILASMPVISVWSFIVAGIQSKLAVKEQNEQSKTGTVAQEALANIRTVMAFGGQDKELKRYEDGLVFALSSSRKRVILHAFGQGLIWFLTYASYALAFWYGTKLIFEGRPECGEGDGEYGPAAFIVIFFNVLTASFRFGYAMSFLDTFATGRGAAASIYKVLDRTPVIDSYTDSGINPKGRLVGKVEFQDVRFSYPSRPEVRILQGMNLAIQPGSTVALVGNSGCGKSTCLQLLQRFYDPVGGSVSVDGVDIRNYNIKWYRSQIGVVSQEPVLFNTTIAENIRYGRDDVTQNEIEEACRLSNAHAFIARLPQKYNTIVGDRGAQLSGGQKQRIAIARALVRNPAILLLDEATSALDTQSEKVVQRALDKASEGRTTLIVAHRLSTIRNADTIVTFENGRAVEMGTHDELLARKGIYYHLVTTQTADETISGVEGESGTARKQSLIPEDSDIDELNSVRVESNKDATEKVESSFFKLFKLNLEEWPMMILGLIMAILNGLVLPVYAFYFGEFMDVLSETDAVVAQDRANYYAIVFVILGVIAGITIFGSMGCFGLAGEALTNRLRKLAFRTMMQQDLAWFDDQRNSIGALCSRLSGDAASVQGATGSRLSTVVNAFTTILFSCGLSLYVVPRVGAVALSFVPLILIATFYSNKMLESQQVDEKAATDEASKLAFQAVSNVRTVASLCKENTFVEMYRLNLLGPHKTALKHSHTFGFVYGFSQSLLYFAYAATFYYGSTLIKNEGLDYTGIFMIGEALIWSMFVLGQTLAFAPNYNKGKVAGGRILKLLASRPSIDCSHGVGLQIRSSEGKVDFDRVEFSYPTRRDAKILKGLSLNIEPNLNIGICGPSGSGKSTCIQLIMRYYDPETGTVRLDGNDIGALNVPSLRSQMALVAQEPALFDRTLAENIAYGDNSREVDMEEIMRAARAANIHNFITSLPGGYSTRVGDMGAQLSGGQKQRVAIARALVRNPRLLLLDEATSALDAESEKSVQTALDNASSGRTCITIAHRLTSIQNADKILVINSGTLSESGTHAELLQKRGVYYKLWKMQHHNLSG